MINITLKLGNDIIIVKVEGNCIAFCDINIGQYTTIEGLKLNRVGVIKEFPDLDDDDEWRLKAIERFKEHISILRTEIDKAKYVAEDLTKYGYEVMMYQRNGFRPQKTL
jgi:hypothetical protein